MLAKKGLTGIILGWIKNFLTKRKIQVNIEDHLSEEFEIDNGVPQGSGISTLLFDMILSNIPNLNIKPVKSKEFADDVAFSVTTKTYGKGEMMMQDAIERFVSYTKSVGLKISAEKTKAMVFTLKKYREPFLTLEGKEIEVEKEFKYLGIIFDAPRLTWSKHIQYTRSKSQQGTNLVKYLSSTKWGADRESLLKLNQALVRSRLTYGSPVFVSMCSTNYNKLEVVQNQGLRLATGCMKTTYIPALQAEANVIPLDIYIKQQAIKYYYKLKIQDDEHCIKEMVFNDNRNENRYYNERAVRKPFEMKTREILRAWRLPINPNMKNLTYPCIPPWENFEESIQTELIINITKKHKENQLLQTTLETLETRYKNALRIYTDGSKKSQPLSTTAAFFIPEKGIRKLWKLHPHISIEGAELSAIVKATEWLKDSEENPTNAVILTDSKVSLQLVKHRTPKNYEYGVSQIQNNIRVLTRRGCSISLQWVPSHCGVIGNEVADSLANEAHDEQEIDEYPIERRELEVLVNTAAQRQWEQRWDINRRNCILGQRKQELKDWKWCRSKNRQVDVAITRLRTGKCKLRYYMHKIGLAEHPDCINCNMNTEEPLHTS